MPPDESLRDTLTSAFDGASSTPPGGESPAPAPIAPSLAPSEPPSTPPPGEGAADGRPRDEKGRYLEAPKPKRDLLAPPADAVKPAEPTDAHPAPGEAHKEAPEPARFKAPQSWKGETKALFASLPHAVQAEIHRRESDVTRGMEQAATARAAIGELQQAIAPFLNNIRIAHNGNVVGAVQVLLQTDNTLRHGTQAEKSRVLADVIKNYGVDLQTLDAILAGQPVSNDPSEQVAQRLRAEMQQQLQPVLGFFNQFQQRQASQREEMQRESATAVEAFEADPANVHFDEVRDEMADLMEVATRRGLTLSMKQAYDRAIALHPDLVEAEAKRKEQERANAAAEAAQRARRAAVSLPSGGAPSGAPGGSTQQSTLREDLERAMAAQAAR